MSSFSLINLSQATLKAILRLRLLQMMERKVMTDQNIVFLIGNWSNLAKEKNDFLLINISFILKDLKKM